jgi:uncharacterized membrane-anchored protein YhcB (DUF1043 family)
MSACLIAFFVGLLMGIVAARLPRRRLRSSGLARWTPPGPGSRP